MNNLFKKFFVVSLIFATVMLTAGTALQPVQAALSAGDLVKGPNSSAVYYIGADSKKYVFPDAKTYFTWYKNFNGIKMVTVNELDMYPSGGAVTYRPGTKMVKTVDSNKVWAVEPGGKLRWITSEAAAITLWGANWAKMVNDVIPGYFASTYVTGSDLGSMYPTGQLIQKTGDATIYYVSGDSIRPFASNDAFTVNSFDYVYVIKVASLSGYSTGSSITGQESALSSINASSNVPVVAGTLNVALASDTPATGLAAGNAARFPFTKINLTTGANPVTVDSIVVKRGGAAQDGSFASVDILNGNTMLPIDASSKTFNSSHEATFTKDFTIPANTTLPIILSGNMALSLTNYSGEVPTLGITAMTLTAGSTLVASLPITGNYQNLNGTFTIGTSTISRGSYTNATSTTLEVGRTDYTFFSFQVQANSVEDQTIKQMSVYQEGTAVLGSDVTNLKLLRDGTKVADGVIDPNNSKYVSFTLSSPLTLPKGQTFQFQVKADINGGSARTVDLGFYRTTDMMTTGQTYGYNSTPTYASTGSSTSSPVLSDNTFTISNGTMVVERSTTVGANNIAIGNDQVLGAFKFTVKGEPIDVTSLTLAITSSSTGTIEDALDNVKLVDANGRVVMGPQSVTNNSTNVIMTDTLTVPVGENVYKVVGNLVTSGGWTNNSTIYATINTPSSVITARGSVTGNSITATPASAVSTNTQTIKGSALSVTRNTLPASSTTIKGAQDVLLGSWTLDATNSGEDVRITSMAFAASSSNATNLTVYNGVFGSGGVAMSPIMEAPTDPATGNVHLKATSTFAFDTPIVVTKGTSKTVQLVGDINTGATTNDSAQFGLTDTNSTTNASVVAYGVGTGNRATVSLTADDGAVLTYAASGSVVAGTYNNPAKGLVRAGATGVNFGAVKFDSSSESLDLDNLTVFVADGAITGTSTGNYQDVTTVYIYDGSTLLASNAIPSTGYYTFNFPNGTLTVPKDGSKTLTIKADVSTINQNTDNNPGTPGADIAFGFGGKTGFQFTGNDSNSTVGSSSETYNGSTTTAMVLHKALPTVAYSQSGSTLGAITALTNGAQDLYKFRVSADSSGNEVLLYRTSFAVATGGTTVLTVTGCYLKDQNGTNVSGVSTNSVTPTDIDGSTTNLLTFVFNNASISDGNDKEALQIAAGSSMTYTLNCTIGTAASGDYVAVSLLGDTASSTSAEAYGTPTTSGLINIASDFSAYNQGNFVWSDNYKNRGLGTDGANATAWGQWYNGYLVSGLGELTTTTAYTVSWAN